MASCQRDVPKSHYFSGSAHAVGGQHIFILSLRLAGAIYTRIAHGAAMKLARRKFLHLAAGAVALPTLSRSVRALGGQCSYSSSTKTRCN